MLPIRLIFCSRRIESSPKVVDTILGVSQINNLREDLTSALVVGEQHFAQVIEGDRASVSRRFARIPHDPRHRDVHVVSAGEVAHRLFPDHRMQRIDIADIDGEIVDRFLISGAFQPHWMSQAALEEFFRILAEQAWDAQSRTKSLPSPDKELDNLRQIHRAARQVIDGNLKPGKLDRDKLERLQASVLRQAGEARLLQQWWAGDGASDARQAEVAELILYFDSALAGIAERLGQAPSSRSRRRKGL